MKNLFLLLSIAGIVGPYFFIFKFIEANNWEWSTSLFFEQINANPAMKILNADLTVAATTFLIFIIYISLKTCGDILDMFLTYQVAGYPGFLKYLL